MKPKISQPSMNWIIFLFIMFAFKTSQSQTYSLTLTFAAIDSITQQSLTIDSVMIENLSRPGTVMAYGPDPQATFVWSAINEPGTHHHAPFELLTCFPNPFYSTSTVTIDVFKQQKLQLTLISQSGEVLARMSKNFNAGRQRFRVSAGGRQIYFLSVKGGGVSKAVKLISMAEGKNNIEYIGQTGLMKSVESTNEFNFSPGDTLRYTTYADGYVDFVTSDAPVESTDYTWDLIPVTFYNPPTVVINTIAAITQHSAMCTAAVTNDGGMAVTARGVCWSMSPEPTVDDQVTVTGQGLGNYISELTELTPGTEYFVRAWATNVVGTAYSEQTLSFMSSYAVLYVPGGYQGWDPPVAPVIYDFNNDFVFTGFIFFPPDESLEFKFTTGPSWEYTAYGYGGEGILDPDVGADNLSVPQPGGYGLQVDIQNLTWSYDLQNWAVIGQWLNWEDDIDMVWDIQTQQLSVTVEDIPAAADQRFRFRANDAWDITLGAIDPPDGQTLMYDGSDIPIPEGGTITFILRFTTPMPTYQLVYR